jgi:hypothetical protein
VAIAWVSQDEAWIAMQGKNEGDFAGALAWARELARMNRCRTIYTFDDSTSGNA